MKHRWGPLLWLGVVLVPGSGWSAEPDSKANLTGFWEISGPACAEDGSCTLTGTIDVLNVGGRCAGTIGVQFFLSDDRQLDARDLKLGKSAVRPLDAATGQRRITLRRQVRGDAPTLGRYLIAQLDTTNRVAESEEADNIVVSPPLSISVARRCVAQREPPPAPPQVQCEPDVVIKLP